MNCFKVVPGSQADFEQVWTTRDTHLRDVPGFVTFHLLRGPDREDHTLYSSHSIWRSRADFEAWTRSEAFRRAHNTAGSNKPLYLGHPEFEGFEVLQTVEGADTGTLKKGSGRGGSFGLISARRSHSACRRLGACPLH